MLPVSAVTAVLTVSANAAGAPPSALDASTSSGATPADASAAIRSPPCFPAAFRNHHKFAGRIPRRRQANGRFPGLLRARLRRNVG